MPELTLAVHGLVVSVLSEWDAVLDSVRADFAWFEAPEGAMASVRVAIVQAPPDYDALGEATASFVTPRNIVYQVGGRTVVDYFGKAVSVLDRSTGELAGHRRGYPSRPRGRLPFLLSRIGEHLDRIGLIRLHALALSGRSGAIAVMLPSGGGKSTLALRALQDDDARLLAEDTPLVDRHGLVHPFPLRIGINATDAERLPTESVRRIERMEFHPKLVIDLDVFRDRIDPTPRPLRHIVVGVRSLGREAKLEELPRRAAVGPMLREAVIGVGVYQGMEFVLQQGFRDVAGKAGPPRLARAAAGPACGAHRSGGSPSAVITSANWEALRPLLT